MQTIKVTTEIHRDKNEAKNKAIFSIDGYIIAVLVQNPSLPCGYYHATMSNEGTIFSYERDFEECVGDVSRAIAHHFRNFGLNVEFVNA